MCKLSGTGRALADTLFSPWSRVNYDQVISTGPNAENLSGIGEVAHFSGLVQLLTDKTMVSIHASAI